MFATIRYRWQLWRVHQQRKRNYRAFRRKVAAVTTPEERHRVIREDDLSAIDIWQLEPEQQRLETEYTRRVAERFNVPVPTISLPLKPGVWEFSEPLDTYLLTPEARWKIWSRIWMVKDRRAQRRQRSLSLVIALVGVFAAAVSALVTLGLLHRLP